MPRAFGGVTGAIATGAGATSTPVVASPAGKISVVERSAAAQLGTVDGGRSRCAENVVDAGG